jgi:hypothetical protein
VKEILARLNPCPSRGVSNSTPFGALHTDWQGSSKILPENMRLTIPSDDRTVGEQTMAALRYAALGNTRDLLSARFFQDALGARDPDLVVSMHRQKDAAFIEPGFIALRFKFRNTQPDQRAMEISELRNSASLSAFTATSIP